MRIETNAANRKDVVKAVSGILGQPAKYMGVPSCAYEVGNCTIDRSGAVETGDEKTAEMVRAGLLEQGLIENPQAEVDETTVSLPVDGMTVEELGGAGVSDTETFLQAFQNHADGCRGISFPDGKAAFTLPAINDPDMIRAFTELTAAMAQQAREQKRIKPKETIEVNEKYYMRIWLLRLGFGGAEGKEVRTLLIKNLKGHTAFRTDANKQKWQEARRNEKEAASQQEQGPEETAESENGME